MKANKRVIGFVSTRFAGTDGVSLETEKWANILTDLGYECTYFAGLCDRPPERTYLVPEAHFKHPAIDALNEELFGRQTRSSRTSKVIQAFKDQIKDHLYKYARQFDVSLLIVENALSLPMNIPLGLALTEFIAETNIPTIAHHHDFRWERARYAISAVSDYLTMAFPPILPSIHHVVINSFARRQLALRTGSSSVMMPNVMDFDNPPGEPDKYANDFRASFGIGEDEFLLLQPTRIVPRKRIELAIELARRLDSGGCTLLITHAAGDEGTEYQQFLAGYAENLGVRMLCASDRVEIERGMTSDKQKGYSLADAYQHANIVTYPSAVEGFGNAFLESIYYHRPIVISSYEIFKTDIEPKGFRVIEFEDFITNDVVRQTRDVLMNPELAVGMAKHNYAIGKRYYSYQNLEKQLVALMSESLGN